MAGLLTVLCGLTPALGQVITQTEQDDSFSTANPTGLTAGSSGLKVAYGHSSDGLYGVVDGDGSGDFDFFKLTANAGQVITVDLKNAGTSDDFDSLVAIYGPDGTMKAFDDDTYGRASKLTYTATVAGTYYVVVSNWVNVDSYPAGSLPADPTIPGTGFGSPGGTGGPYQVFIGLDAVAPIVQYDSLVSTNPVPVPVFRRVVGRTDYLQSTALGVANTGNAPLTITGWNFTGPDAAKFSVQGPALPITLNPNQVVGVTVLFAGDGVQATSHASLDPVSNDPLGIKLALTTKNPIVSGGGSFTVRQVHATAGTVVNNFDVADALLAGTNAATSATQQNQVVNYANGGVAQGYFGGDRAFPDTAGSGNQFATQATGTFYVRQAGFYSFRGIADDGQRLRIDGEQVFISGTANSPSFGVAELTVGTHTLEYTMYEIGGGDQMELSIAQDIGEFFANTETTWELLEAYSPDSDGDGLPNQWEIDNQLDPNSAVGDNGADGDPDQDGLLNKFEFSRHTKANDSDTDDDGLKDGWETGTGVWLDATHTGTDPLVQDSDNDGFRDDVEDPTEAFTGVSQPGTDPNKVDTDGDGYPDRVEVTLGSNPKVVGSVPAITYTPLLTENFDGTKLNSTYTLTNSGGAWVPAVTATGVAANNNALQITDASNSNNNSIAWNKVPSGAPLALRLSFDFRQGSSNPADGVGIGLFRTSAFGETGGANPAAPNKNWENPSGEGGLGNSLALGFGIYGQNVIRMAGPLSPGTALAQVVSPFTLSSNLFHRAIITMMSNGPGGTMVSLQLVQDVNGAATVQQVFTNVLVPGFDIASESFRLIAGGRTGGLFVRQDIDNVNLSVFANSAPSSISIDKVSGQLKVTYTGVLQSSTDIMSGFTDVPGATSPYTVPAGSPARMFYRAR
ncbi:pre-peptidase C-terminal domain-containing protein [Haloferula sp. BvORR071]|uniref:pre-peptidase C-terminal domain-containing protein n=1 Tax=Haloferula sp. BvORR071 TaxID=1396141 RepID=UPI000696C41E|nr:pre-peptidase C-terminal domain-containing protein [Haloferula sp. BvORR071]